MGFLDKQSRVIDFVLTERGRKLFAVGQLDFAHFALFDDRIDYDPHHSGTLSFEQREEAIQDLLMLEAPYIPDVLGADAPLEPTYHIFTAAPNYAVMPRMSSPVDGDSHELRCTQYPDRGMFARQGSNYITLDMKIEGEVESAQGDYSVKVFSSGSNGLKELDPRRDMKGRMSYDPFLSIIVDVDPPPDGVARTKK